MQSLTVLGLFLLVALASAGGYNPYGSTYGSYGSYNSYRAPTYGSYGSYGAPTYGSYSSYNSYRSHGWRGYGKSKQDLSCAKNVAGEYLLSLVQNYTTVAFDILVISPDGDIFAEDSNSPAALSSYLGTYTCTSAHSIVGTSLAWDFANQTLLINYLAFTIIHGGLIQGQIIVSAFDINNNPLISGPYAPALWQAAVYASGVEVEAKFASELTPIYGYSSYGYPGYGYSYGSYGYPGYGSSYGSSYGYPGHGSSYGSYGYPTYGSSYGSSYGYPTTSYSSYGSYGYPGYGSSYGNYGYPAYGSSYANPSYGYGYSSSNYGYY